MHCRTDRFVAPLAADVGLPIGVPVARRDDLLSRRATYARHAAAHDPPVAPRRTVSGQARSMVTRSITTGSTGRSPRPVWAAEIASTTSRPASSATSPKIVCLRLSQGWAPTVMKNCDPLVPGTGVGHGQQVGPVEHAAQGGSRRRRCSPGPPVPVPSGSPPWIMNPGSPGGTSARRRTAPCPARPTSGRSTPWCPRRARRSCGRSSAHGWGTAHRDFTVVGPDGRAQLLLVLTCQLCHVAVPLPHG